VASNFLVTQSSVIPLNSIALDDSKDTVLESHSECGTRKVIVRKEGEKDLWIEVWSDALNGGLLKTTKLSAECSKVYMDAVFGTVAWAKDLSKIAFIGEEPAVAAYKNPWDMPEKEEEGKAKPWQEEKYLYAEEFGELLVGKKTAALFVYDLTLNKV
jgi:hypothetical protein